MKIGLSYSRCVRDIVDGRVDIDDVLIIIARTDFDHTVFTELAEDVAEKSAWIKDLKTLSPNEQRMHLGLERIDNPLFDEPWITTQDGMPLSEYDVQEEEMEDESPEEMDEEIDD